MSIQSIRNTPVYSQPLEKKEEIPSPIHSLHFTHLEEVFLQLASYHFNSSIQLNGRLVLEIGSLLSLSPQASVDVKKGIVLKAHRAELDGLIFSSEGNIKILTVEDAISKGLLLGKEGVAIKSELGRIHQKKGAILAPDNLIELTTRKDREILINGAYWNAKQAILSGGKARILEAKLSLTLESAVSLIGADELKKALSIDVTESLEFLSSTIDCTSLSLKAKTGEIKNTTIQCPMAAAAEVKEALSINISESLKILASKINGISLSLKAQHGEVKDTVIQTKHSQRIAFHGGTLKEALQIAEEGKITTLFGHRGVIDKSTQIIDKGSIIVDAQGSLSLYKLQAAALEKVRITANQIKDRYSKYIAGELLYFKARVGDVTLRDLTVQECMLKVCAEKGNVFGNGLHLQQMHGILFKALQGRLSLESVTEKGSGHLTLAGSIVSLKSNNFWNQWGGDVYGKMINLDHTHFNGGKEGIIFFDSQSTLICEYSVIEGKEIRERAQSIYLNQSNEKGLIRKDAPQITLLDSEFNGEALLLTGQKISVRGSKGKPEKGHVVSEGELTWSENDFEGKFTFLSEQGYFAESKHVGDFITETMKELDLTRFSMKGNIFSAQAEKEFKGYRMRLDVNRIDVKATDVMAPESDWKGYERIYVFANELAHLPDNYSHTKGIATFQARHLNMDRARTFAGKLRRVGSESLSARSSCTIVQGPSSVLSQEGQVDVEGALHNAKEKVVYLAPKGVNHNHSGTFSRKLEVQTKILTNREGDLEGDSEMKLDHFDNRAGNVKTGGERSRVSVNRMVNDEKSHVSGEGDFYLTSRRPHIDKGEYDLGGKLDITAPLIQKKGKTKAKSVSFNATEDSITQDGELIAEKIKWITPSIIRNFGIIYSTQQSYFHSLFLDNQGEIGSGGTLFIHQKQFQLPGNVWSQGKMTFSANEPLIFTTPLENRGGIGLLAEDYPITMHAPVRCGGEFSMAGSDLFIHENLNVEGRGIFHTPGLTHFDHITAFFGDGFEVEAGTYHSDVSRVDAYGHSSINAQKALFGSEVTSLGNTPSIYPVRPSHMRIVGDFEFTIGEKAVNEASDLLVSGTMKLAGSGNLFNINRTHTHSWRECVGIKDKRCCWIRYGGEPIYEDRQQQIIDRRANTHIGADIQFEMDGAIHNDGAFYGDEMYGKIGSLYNGIFHSRGRTPSLGKAPDKFSVLPSEENSLFRRRDGGRYKIVGDVPQTLPDYTLNPSWLFDKLRVPHEGLTFLCDPYVEGSAVQERAQFYTGRGSFEPGHTTPLDVRWTLYNRAYKFAEEHQKAQLLHPLPASLQNEIGSPLLWYVQANDVIEPVVYLPNDWSTFRPGGDFVGAGDIDLEISTLHNRGYLESKKTLRLTVEDYLNEKRLSEETAEIAHTKSWGRISKERVTVDHVNHGGETIGNKVILHLGKGRNRGGHIASREPAGIYADDFINEPLQMRSVVHLDNGNVAPWKSAKGGSVRTDFLGGHIESGSTLLFDIKNSFLNDASHIVAMKDLTVRAGDIFQRTRFSSFLWQSKKRWFDEKDISSIVMAEGSMVSILGDTLLQSRKADIRIQGSVGSCAQDLTFDSARDIWMEAVDHEVHNYASKITFTPTSATWRETNFNSTRSSLPSAFSGGDTKYTANRNVIWDALQLNVGNDCEVKADSFDRRGHQVHKWEESSGYSLNLNFTGKAAIEAGFRGEGIDGFGEGLLREDALIDSAFNLARSRDEADLFVNGVMTGVRGYNTFNELSKAISNGNLGNTLTKRWGLTDERGNFNPDISMRFGISSSSTRWSESIGSNAAIGRNFNVKVNTLREQGGITKVGQDCDYEFKQLIYRPIQDYFFNDNQEWGFTIGHSSQGFYIGGDYTGSNLAKKNHTPSHLDVKVKWRVKGESADIEGLAANCSLLDYETQSTTLSSTLDEHDASHLSVGANTKGNVSFSAGDESKRKIGTRTTIKAQNGGRFKSHYLKTASASVEGAKMDVQKREDHTLEEKEKSRSVDVSLNMNEITNTISGDTEEGHIPEIGTIHVRHNGSHWGLPLVGVPGGSGTTASISPDLMKLTPEKQKEVSPAPQQDTFGKPGPSTSNHPSSSNEDGMPPIPLQPFAPQEEFIPIPKQKPAHPGSTFSSTQTFSSEKSSDKQKKVEGQRDFSKEYAELFSFLPPSVPAGYVPEEFLPLVKPWLNSKSEEAFFSTSHQKPPAQEPSPVGQFMADVSMKAIHKVCRSSETAEKVCRAVKNALAPPEPVDPQREAELEEVYRIRKKELLERRWWEHAGYNESLAEMHGAQASTQFLSKVFEVFGMIAEPVVNYAVDKASQACHSTEATTKACRAAKEWWNDTSSQAQKELAKSSHKMAKQVETQYGIPREVTEHVNALVPGVVLGGVIPFGRKIAPKVTKISRSALNQTINRGLTPAVRQALKDPKKVRNVTQNGQKIVKVVGKKAILEIEPKTETLLKVMPRETVISSVLSSVRTHVRQRFQTVGSAIRPTVRHATQQPYTPQISNDLIRKTRVADPRLKAAKKAHVEYVRGLKQEQSVLLNMTKDVPQIKLPEGFPQHLNKFSSQYEIYEIKGSKVGKSKRGVLQVGLPYVQLGDKILFVLSSPRRFSSVYRSQYLSMFERQEYILEKALNFAHKKGNIEAFFAWEPTKQPFATTLERCGDKVLGTSVLSTGINSKPLTVAKVGVEKECILSRAKESKKKVVGELNQPSPANIPSPIRLKSINWKANHRLIHRHLAPEKILDALKNPYVVHPIKVDRHGKQSQVIVGRKATLVINPKTERLITAYTTKDKDLLPLRKSVAGIEGFTKHAITRIIERSVTPRQILEALRTNKPKKYVRHAEGYVSKEFRGPEAGVVVSETKRKVVTAYHLAIENELVKFAEEVKHSIEKGKQVLSTENNSQSSSLRKKTAKMDGATLSIVQESQKLMKESTVSHGAIACHNISDQMEKLIPLLPHSNISQEKLWKELAKDSSPVTYYINTYDRKIVHLGDIVFRDVSIDYAPDIITELNGLYFLNSLNLKEIKIAKPLFIRKHDLCVDEHIILARSYLPGQDFNQLFKEHAKMTIGSSERETNLIELTTATLQLGKGIGEYTQKGVQYSTTISEMNVNRAIRDLENTFEEAVEYLQEYASWSGEKVNITVELNELSKLIEAFKKSPGHATIGCGDPHLAQYIWSKNKQSLGFQDAEMVFQTLNQHWLPQSFQANDYWELLFEIDYKGFKNKFSAEEINALKKAFSKGFFSKFSEQLPDASNRFFECYRKLSMIKNLAENNSPEFTDLLRLHLREFNKKYSSSEPKKRTKYALQL